MPEPGAAFLSPHTGRPPFDPAAAPVVGVDSHLPPIDPGVWDAPALRRRFLEPPDWRPEVSPETRAATRSLVAAAVLIGIVQRAEPTVLFTRRSDRMRHHPGQVSFPGGRAEPHDVDLTGTALREAHEEIGLQASQVQPLGTLPAYVTTSGFVVSSLVALVDPAFASHADPGEVAEVFEVPLQFLMTPANHRRHEIDIAGVRRRFFSIPWAADDASSVGAAPYLVWGATAAMLRNLYWFLAA